jgi:hypothetical protein
MTLLAYRLRPLPGAVLGGLPIVLVSGTWWLAPLWGTSEAIRVIQVGAVLLGVVAAFTVSRDVDAPEPVLAGTPHPFWRTPAVRAALWLTGAWGVVSLLGEVIDERVVEPFAVSSGVSLAHADLVFVAGLAFVVAIRAGSFIGGAAALVGLLVCTIIQRLWIDWPLRVLDPVGAPHWEDTRTLLTITGLSCFVLGFLYLRARGLPMRRPAT